MKYTNELRKQFLEKELEEWTEDLQLAFAEAIQKRHKYIPSELIFVSSLT